MDITNIKKTFAIYPINNNFKVSLQYNNENYYLSFETEDECISYIKDMIGEEEYKKREFAAFNYNFKKHIEDNNLLAEEQEKIWKMICKRYSGMGVDISRKSHVKKIKELNLYDVFCQLDKQNWKCYYSNLEFDTDINYMRPSIDRIDSINETAYSKDNCVIVLEFCQYLKNAYDLTEFKRCIKSIATGVLDENETITNSLIGGGRKKGIKDWKQINLNMPLKMSKIQYYIYQILKNKDEYLSRVDITKKIKEEFHFEWSKQGLQSALKNNNYILFDKTNIAWKYKLKDKDEIKSINENTKICCGQCQKEISILDFRKREPREGNKGLDLNLYHTICTTCNTKYNNKYKNKDIQTFILRQISDRNNKKGNITKDNFNELKGSNGNCAITGLPLIIENNSGKFNQCSPDRIDSTKKYDLDNVQVVCLAINFGKKNYNISNDTILDIIVNIYKNLSKF
jgi:hypothetical protein|tara:strand:- start:61 stop:1428 length:1368 start_codon:yes stop_codon:yes gene_type:complete